MERLQLALWTIEVNREETLNFNRNILEACDCLYCMNFAEVVKRHHPVLSEKLIGLGIDAAIPNHVSYFDGEKGGEYLAIGNYHFSGTLVEGKWSTMDNWEDGNTAVMDGMEIGLSKEMELLPDNFPEPAIQVNFELRMPWILEENPEEI
ncbi:hypothetical protein M4S82_01340 [Planococcus sp. MERTA32b]|nr:hypothetical protein [Planococcus sp. MER TA 32b]